MAASGGAQRSETHYTVFIKVPFPRGNFIDPAPVLWDSSKDRSLWKMLSSASKGTEIDWSQLAEQFDVTLPFLLQQAAWLYELKLSQVREQLRRVNRPASISASPTPPLASSSATVGAQPMRRAESGGSRISSLSTTAPRGSPRLGGEGSVPSTPGLPEAPPIQRTISTNTIRRTQRSSVSQAPTNTTSPQIRPRRNPSPSQAEVSRSPSPSPSSSASSSSGSSSPAPQTRSRFMPRRPRHAQNPSQHAPLSTVSSGSNSSGEAPAFLPFSGAGMTPAQEGGTAFAPGVSDQHSLSETVSTRRPANSPSPPPSQPTRPHETTSSFSSRRPQQPFPSISAAFPSSRTAHQPKQQTPSQTAAGPSLASAATTTASPPRRSNTTAPPRQPTSASSKNNSSPSTFSSFSSLDDDGVTRSALEEALLRQMDGGGSSGASGLGR